MKNMILITLLTLQILGAAELIYPDGKKEQYIAAKADRSTDSTAGRYLHKKRIYQDTGTIYVSFGEHSFDRIFLQKYHLKFLKETNPTFHTVLFRVLDKRDIVALCSEINLQEAVRYARPNWKSLRGLR